jgi:hypothetical protein
MTHSEFTRRIAAGEDPREIAGLDFGLDTIGDDLRAAARTLVDTGAVDAPWVATRASSKAPDDRLVCLYGPSLFALALRVTEERRGNQPTFARRWWMPAPGQENTPMGRLALAEKAERERLEGLRKGKPSGTGAEGATP